MGTVATRQSSGTAMIRVIALVPYLVLVSGFPSKLNSIGHSNHHSHHNHDENAAASRNIESYLSPVEYEDEDVSATRIVDSYLIPVEYDEEPAASQAVDSYLLPDEEAAAQEPVRTFAAEEEAAAAASINEVFVLPEGGDLAGYGAEEDLLLAGYGEQDQALDSYATSYGRY